MDKDDDDEPSVWVTVIKLVIVAVVLIGGTGYALYYVDQVQQNAHETDTSKPPKIDWGVATDSPLRPNR